MALSVRAGSSAEDLSGTVNAITVAKPTGTIDGDVMYALLIYQNTVNMTGLTGWTQLSIGNVGFKVELLEKRANGEGANYTFPFSGNTAVTAQIISIAGAKTTGSAVNAGPSGNNGVDTSVEYLSVTTSVANTLLVAFGAAGTVVDYGAPAGFTELLDGSLGTISYQAQAATGATGDFVGTISTATQWVAAMIAVEPALPVTVTPGTLALTLTSFAPTVSVTANQLVTPGTASLVTTGFAPTVSVTANQLVTPGTLALSLTTFSPTISVTDNQTVTPGTLALVITSFAPTVTATDNQTVTPSTAALVLTTFAPTVTATANQSVTPGTLALVLTAFAPTVTTTANVLVTPATASLVITSFAPVVSVSNNQIVVPATASLVLTTFAPTVVVSAPIPGYITLSASCNGAFLSAMTPGADLYSKSPGAKLDAVRSS